MEKLNRANRGGNGLKPLSQFMNPGEKNPTALAVELFFRTNISVIKEVYPDIIEREGLREELKDRFERLLHQPLRNSLYIYYRKWRAVSPDCQFGYLIKVVKTIYEKYVRKQFNLQSMKGYRQRPDESVRDYNERFRNRLAKIYPNYENSLYRAPMNEAERDDHWRMEIVNIYVASLVRELREKIPIFDSNNKYLEHAMNTAEFHEKEHIDREEKHELIDRMERKGTKRVSVNRISQFDETRNERKSIICHNCGVKGHFKTECRKPLTECQHCGKRGHLIQYCFGRRVQQRGNSTSNRSKLAAVTLATIVISLILGITGVRGETEGVERYQSEPKIVTDIFKVTNHVVGCQIVRYIPMVGDELFFYPTKGTEKISFIAEKSKYIECECDYKKEGFKNPHTNDCYIPSNTSVTFNGERAQWDQLEMELRANADPRDFHWLAWNTYVFARIKANHIPSHIQTIPFAHLKYLMDKGLTDKELKRRKVEHIAKYEEMKKFVDAGPEQTAINLEEDREELQSEIDLAIQEHRSGEDPFEFYSTFTKSTEDQDLEDSAETSVSRGSTRYESIASVPVPSKGASLFPRGTPPTPPSIIPQVRVPTMDPPSSTSPSIMGSIGNYPLRTTDLAKELKSEGLKKSIANLIERSKDNDVRGVVDALMNSFNIAEGMESVGVLAVCVSVMLGAYYKRRVVNSMIQSILNRIRGRTADEYSVRSSDYRPRIPVRQEPESDDESTELRPLSRKYAPKTEEERKEFYDLCDTDILPFGEKEERLKEAVLRAGYTLMARISSLDRYKHTPTVVMSIHETWLQVFIDDGSDVSLISEKQWERLGRPHMEYTTAWIDNTHNSVGFLGVTELNVSTRKLKGSKEKFYVTPELTLDVIIGRTFLSRYPRYTHNYEKETITIGTTIIPKAWADPNRKMVLMAAENTAIPPGQGMDFH